MNIGECLGTSNVELWLSTSHMMFFYYLTGLRDLSEVQRVTHLFTENSAQKKGKELHMEVVYVHTKSCCTKLVAGSGSQQIPGSRMITRGLAHCCSTFLCFANMELGDLYDTFR